MAELQTIEIPRELTKKGDLMVVPKKEYQAFLKLKDEIEDALKKIMRGEKELKEGKTKVVSSPKDLRR